MSQPQVLVRDKQTGHEYTISAAKFARTPHLWDRLGSTPAKPRTTVEKSASRKRVPVVATAPENVPEQGDEEGQTSGHLAESSKEES